ncbi:unnamed protein product [Rotaria sp. Silwood1]|nr:unnamed protein product [Rotaria sp. Silwood1]CAF3412805.1 unnamed protein product [Rotaria sp. Silwood1]CAF3416667.1 unnamed protein product [Rotaria sp. Silwood1]CAF4670011.1 unnamed protein product [Rotaria sp. Silwood1]CAF4943216.1 unnamed protein product [Rotaria sp. Silwood1]
MLALILLIFLTVGVSTINSYTCTCCFHGSAHTCQTPAIHLPSCADCTGFFCANHVKGCQGSPPCEVECNSDSSSKSTPRKSSSSMQPISTTSNSAPLVQVHFIMIFVGLTLSAFVN